MRFGIILGRDSGAFNEMLPLFQWGLGGPLGCGKQWWSWVHLEDAVNAIIHGLTNPLEGPVNVVSREPIRQKDFARHLGKALKRPAFMPMPAPLLKLILGGFSSELLSSRRVVPRKLEQSGFGFRFPELGKALEDLVDRASEVSSL